ncbi:MAG: choice-of-anchor tandem repeat GloVer-containing protein [Verrucomicrobiia bacterium]
MKIHRVVLAIMVGAWLGQPGRASADTLKTLHTFAGTLDGSAPYGGLTEGSDGNFYGTTESGGGSGFGTVFSMTGAGTLSTIWNFGGGLNDGANPEAGLIQGSDGFLYGTTYAGGTDNVGIVFKVSTTGGLTPLHYFTDGGDGANPQGVLVEGSDSNFYGTTSAGANGFGTVFRVSSAGAFTVLYAFSNGSDGGNPKAGLVQGTDSNFYGTAYGGGASNAGTVFSYNSSTGLSPLTNFTGGADGANPQGALVEGSDGNFYGTTFGGANGYGTVFRISTNGNLTPLWDFGDGSDGGNPEAGLILGQDGNFYGTTSTGGNDGPGTVFKITKNGALTTLYNFTGGNDGAVPLAGLLQASATNFLGTTSAAGADSLGTVFSLIQPCTFSLSPSGVALIGIAESGTFTVTSSGTGCVWTATSKTDWITVTSGSSGIGDGVVGYSVTADSESKTRVGTIVVGGKTFTITQGGEVFGQFLPGSYSGLVMDTNLPAQASSGSISLVFGLTTTGSFAADLTMGGVKSTFKGQFDRSGNSTNTVPLKGSSPLIVILQAMPVTNGTDQIVGTVSDGGTFTAQLVANLAVFSKENMSPWVGAFTFVLPPADSTNSAAPQGYGYGTLTVTSLGSGSLKGVLGDGTKISGKFPVSGYGTWPLYNSLYKNGGSCIGWVTFAESNTLTGPVYWFKTAASGDQFYPAGFSTTNSLTGDIYVPPAAGGPSVAATGQLTLGGGNLTSKIVISVSISAKGTGTASPVGSNDLKLKVAPTTGALSGSFLDPTVGKAVKFEGLLLQSSGAASGYFLGTSESGFVTFVPDTE